MLFTGFEYKIDFPENQSTPRSLVNKYFFAGFVYCFFRFFKIGMRMPANNQIGVECFGCQHLVADFFVPVFVPKVRKTDNKVAFFIVSEE